MTFSSVDKRIFKKFILELFVTGMQHKEAKSLSLTWLVKSKYLHVKVAEQHVYYYCNNLTLCLSWEKAVLKDIHQRHIDMHHQWFPLNREMWEHFYFSPD